MSSRHVRKWIIAAPVIGFVMVGCGSSSTTFTGVGGSGNGGTSPTGSAGSEQGGSAGTTAGSGGSDSGGSSNGGSGGTSSNGGSDSGGSSNGGSGGTGELGYEPVGVGDPWFFSSASDLDAFEVELTGATGAASWHEAGEVHLPLTFAAAEDKAFIHFTAPFDSVTSTHDPMDLTHRVLRARVRIASGATATGGVEPYSQSAGWAWGAGPWNSFADLGSWHEVEYDFDNAATPGTVLRFGLQVFGTSAGSAELIIDDMRLEPKPEEPQPDGGVVEPDGGGEEEPPPVDGDAGAPDAGGGGPGYEPVGIGDPWFFDTEGEKNLFTFAPGYNSTASATSSWSSGEAHLNATCVQDNTVQMYLDTPYNGTTNTANLSGRVLKSRVRVAAGATVTGGGVQLFAQSGGWQWMNGGWNDISALGSTSDVAFDLVAIQDAANVQRFGVQFYCGSAGAVELIVDDIRLEPAD